MGDWSGLESVLKSEIGAGERSWYTQLGRITLSLNQNDLTQVDGDVAQARSVLVDNLTVLGLQPGNEHQGYHCVVKYVNTSLKKFRK